MTSTARYLLETVKRLVSKIRLPIPKIWQEYGTFNHLKKSLQKSGLHAIDLDEPILVTDMVWSIILPEYSDWSDPGSYWGEFLDVPYFAVGKTLNELNDENVV